MFNNSFSSRWLVYILQNKSAKNFVFVYSAIHFYLHIYGELSFFNRLQKEKLSGSEFDAYIRFLLCAL